MVGGGIHPPISQFLPIFELLISCDTVVVISWKGGRILGNVGTMPRCFLIK